MTVSFDEHPKGSETERRMPVYSGAGGGGHRCGTNESVARGMWKCGFIMFRERETHTQWHQLKKAFRSICPLPVRAAEVKGHAVRWPGYCRRIIVCLAVTSSDENRVSWLDIRHWFLLRTSSISVDVLPCLCYHCYYHCYYYNFVFNFAITSICSFIIIVTVSSNINKYIVLLLLFVILLLLLINHH